MVFVVDHDYKIFVANCSSSGKRVLATFMYCYLFLEKRCSLPLSIILL